MQEREMEALVNFPFCPAHTYRSHTCELARAPSYYNIYRPFLSGFICNFYVLIITSEVLFDEYKIEIN